MEEYEFGNFKDDLVHGREMEFKFNCTKYAIVNGTNRNNEEEVVWKFIIEATVEVITVICKFEEREKLLKFADDLIIDKITLKDIIDGELYTDFHIF